MHSKPTWACQGHEIEAVTHLRTDEFITSKTTSHHHSPDLSVWKLTLCRPCANSGVGFMSAEIDLSIFTGEYVSQSAMNMHQVILIQYHPSCNKERKSSLSFPVINSNLRRHRWVIARIRAITPPRNEIWSGFFSAPAFSWSTKLFLLQIRNVIWLNSKSTITAFKAIIGFNILSK